MSYVDNIRLFNILRLRYWQMLNIKEECHRFYTSALESTTVYVKKKKNIQRELHEILLPQVTSLENGKKTTTGFWSTKELSLPAYLCSLLLIPD